ncbi:MAG: alpha/beta-type small acid-soluble spore protein [Clostridia bacterium]|nr:alpha/beta-type small acid-soluble spore protein [Clostridia bacterium]
MAQKNNRIVVPEAKAAMEQFKMEAAREVGVNLENGYNGELTARQAGSIGGQMVKKMSPVRTANFERTNRIADGHKVTVRYTASVIL